MGHPTRIAELKIGGSLFREEPEILIMEDMMKDQKGTHAAPVEKCVYKAFNPRGFKPTIKISPLHPRVPDLNQKVVYIIDSGIFGSYRFTEKIAGLLPTYFPNAKIVYKITSGLFLTSDSELWEEVKKNADSFIYGPAGGTNGFVAGARWSTLLEKKGIPGVYVISEGYEKAVQTTCEKEGMPLLRRVVTPMPAWGEESLSQAEKILKEIIASLTTPLNEEEQKARTIVPEKSPRIAVEGTLEEVQEYFTINHWTDGLPIIPPTEENVAKMLTGTSHAPDEIVTDAMRPDNWIVTVERVAINGVMAGCKPKDMPVLLAMVEAIAKGGLSTIFMSANSGSLMVVVNGPIAREIGMNAGVNALGPGNHANATIGRALRLFVANLAGLTPGVNVMACQGTPTNYSFAFAENEEASPWEPLHVTRGYKHEESCITLFAYGSNHGAGMTGQPEGPLDLVHILEVIRIFQQPQGAVILLAPLLAKRIAAEKKFEKKDLQEYLWKNTVRTAREFRSDPHYATHVEPALRGGKSLHGDTPWPSWYATADDCELVPVFGKSEFICPIIVGGENHEAFQAWNLSIPLTVSIDPWR
jgi:hypothetical protein